MAADRATGGRTRLDEALVSAGLVDSRSRAKRLILAGQVRVDGHTADKPGSAVKPTADLSVIAGERYVSRGGDKLLEPLEASGITTAGRVAIDVGASTGGFTDCLLQAGVDHVIAVDVGYGQLAWKLRQDPRVTVLERTNARNLAPNALAGHPTPSLVVMDLSFISVAKVLPAVTHLVAEAADALVLVKPQFESRPQDVEKGGVVRSGAIRRQALAHVANAAARAGWSVIAARPSPLRGPAGNWECFLQLRHDAGATHQADWDDQVTIPDDRDSGAAA
ncbi:MAG: TlyA family rRNA (cytidine-2'-O)-methyltransferase [Acidobacteria bacterium]|nr:TlyA family rRNA (cytidine-2'-O)-methyltransferase [Acidobacteriota bacterium]